jgi:hypothetical protein
MMFEGFSQKEKLIMLLLLSLLLCSWLGLFPGTCSASGTYQITEAELTQLEENLIGLSTVNDEQRGRLTSLQETLKTSETRLEAKVLKAMEPLKVVTPIPRTKTSKE